MNIFSNPKIQLNYYNSIQFFDKEIDWEQTEEQSLIPLKQAQLIDKIFSCEASIQIFRHCIGIDGYNIDTMSELRKELIDQYEKEYEKYSYPNDPFY